MEKGEGKGRQFSLPLHQRVGNSLWPTYLAQPIDILFAVAGRVVTVLIFEKRTCTILIAVHLYIHRNGHIHGGELKKPEVVYP